MLATTELKESVTIAKVPISKISQSRYQTRFKEFAKEDEIKNLAGSIKENGMLELPKIRPHPDRGGEYEVICGHRRLEAVKLLGLEETDCQIYENLTEARTYNIVVTDNVQRQTLADYEEGEAYRLAIDVFKMQQNDIAQFLHISQSQVAEKIGLARDIDRWTNEVKGIDIRIFRKNCLQSHKDALRRIARYEDGLFEAMGLVQAGKTAKEVSDYIDWYLNGIASRNRNVEGSIESVKQQENERRKNKVDPIEKIEKQVNELKNLVPKEHHNKIEELEKSVSWAKIDRFENYIRVSSEISGKKARKKQFKCTKCKTAYSVEHVVDEQKKMDAFIITPKSPKFKNKITQILFPSSSPLESFSNQ